MCFLLLTVALFPHVAVREEQLSVVWVYSDCVYASLLDPLLG